MRPAAGIPCLLRSRPPSHARAHLKQALLRGNQASSGEEGLDLVTQREYDLLLVDLRLPGMDGMEYLQHAAREKRRAVAMVITGYGSADHLIELLNLGVGYFMNKPFTPDELVGAVRQALKRRETERETQRRDACTPLLQRDSVGNSVGKLTND